MALQWSTSRGLDLHLDLDGAGGRRAAIEDALRDAIRAGRLPAGTSLPSTRTLAADLGVARGTVTDAGAAVLVACPDLRRLERLGIDQNHLTAAGIAALQAAYPKVEAGSQIHPGEEYIWEGDME